MKSFRKTQLKQRLGDHFTEESVETIVAWLRANHGRLPVVVVGAGFTRNALDKRTGKIVEPDIVPLWSHVIRRLEDHLNVKNGEYDFLSLAEYYVVGLGESAFFNTLLNLMPDDNLIPGPAHDALFAYGAEAIITTNQLDTLLDRGPGRQKVITDADLALHDSNEPRRQTIYFHGHRTNLDSWVFTRSQFEDVFKYRPLITTRIRQLLTQHPIVLVGYSLSDPDFHAIYRQISLDMANRHPLGLVIVFSEPNTAVRRHWETLGLRFAVLRSPLKSSEAFAAFFGADPNGPLPEIADVCAYVRANFDFPGRCDYIRDVWAEHDHFRDAPPLIRRYRDSELFQMWCACLDAEELMESEALDAINVTYPGPPLLTGTTNMQPPSQARREFRILPADRFSVRWPVARQLDRMLDRTPPLLGPLAQWLEDGLDRDFFDADYKAKGTESPYLNLRSWLWTKLGHENADHKTTAQARVLDCLRIAERYDFDVLMQFLKTDAAKLGLFDDTLNETPPSPLKGDLRDAFEAAMNGEYSNAFEKYGDAAKRAEEDGDTFSAWIARYGQRTYHPQKFAKTTTDDKRSIRGIVTLLEGEPVVARWNRSADGALRRLEGETLENYQRRDVERTFGTRILHASNHAHDLYTKFRDLEALHAPPSLQVKFLQPLIDHEGFAADPNRELTLRLRYNLKHNDEWLNGLVAASDPDLESRRQRDAGLVQIFKDDHHSKTASLARLRLLPRLTYILQGDDLEWMFSFLQGCRARLGSEVMSYGARSFLHNTYPAAWVACAELCTQATQLGYLNEYRKAISNNIERDRYRRDLDDLPWEMWYACNITTPSTLVDLALDSWMPSGDAARSELNVGDVGRTWALYKIVSAVHQRRARVRAFDRPTIQRIDAWIDNVLTKTNPQGYLWGAYQGVMNTALLLRRGQPARRKSIITRVLDLIKVAWIQDTHSTPALPLHTSILAAALDGGVPPEEIEQSLSNCWERLDQSWNTGRDSGSPLSSQRGPALFLASVLQFSALTSQHPNFRNRLLALIRSDPRNLVSCAPLLHRRFWGSEWSSFVALVTRIAGGNLGNDEMLSRHSALSLWAEWLALDHRDKLPGELSFLPQAGLLSVFHENPLVANVAAYAVVRYAEGPLLRREVEGVLAALRGVAIDPRVVVRHAAGYGAARLKTLAQEAAVRRTAAELDVRLASDSYAWVRRQSCFGAALARNSAR